MVPTPSAGHKEGSILTPALDQALARAGDGTFVIATDGRIALWNRAAERVLGYTTRDGKVAADFATSNVVGSPAALVAAMWNHSRMMEDQAAKQGLKLPRLTGQELADLAAYVSSLTKPISLPRPK